MLSRLPKVCALSLSRECNFLGNEALVIVSQPGNREDSPRHSVLPNIIFPSVSR